MRSLALNFCIFLLTVIVASSAVAQPVVQTPQPDDSPDQQNAQSVIIASFDVDQDRQLDQQELESVLNLLLEQIEALRREVNALKKQLKEVQKHQPKFHTTKKVPLIPEGGGVYGGKFYPDRHKQKR